MMTETYTAGYFYFPTFKRSRSLFIVPIASLATLLDMLRCAKGTAEALTRFPPLPEPQTAPSSTENPMRQGLRGLFDLQPLATARTTSRTMACQSQENWSKLDCGTRRAKPAIRVLVPTARAGPGPCGGRILMHQIWLERATRSTPGTLRPVREQRPTKSSLSWTLHSLRPTTERCYAILSVSIEAL